MSSSTPDQPDPKAGSSSHRATMLRLAALAAVAVPGLDPARLALPQEHSKDLEVTGLIDTQGRHWEVLETSDDVTGAALEAEAEVLRRMGRQVDNGHLSFDVARPGGVLRGSTTYVQVRSAKIGRASCRERV